MSAAELTPQRGLTRPARRIVRFEKFDVQHGAGHKGAIYIFRPGNPESRQVVRLKGLDPKAKYRLWCEDGSIAAHQASGEDLMRTGLAITLPQPFSSDIVFLQDAAAGKPGDLIEPGESKLR